VAHRNLGHHYETNDPLAVAIALMPELALEVIEKCCYIETKGRFTKGMVIVQWYEIFPQLSKPEHRNKDPRRPVKIVTKVLIDKIMRLMMESVIVE
jgi:inosine-uridine nucleoside N-ribohydrolase